MNDWEQKMKERLERLEKKVKEMESRIEELENKINPENEIYERMVRRKRK